MTKTTNAILAALLVSLGLAVLVLWLSDGRPDVAQPMDGGRKDLEASESAAASGSVLATVPEHTGRDGVKGATRIETESKARLSSSAKRLVVSGRVEDDAGRPVVGAAVGRIEPGRAEGKDWQDAVPVALARSGEDGTYRFSVPWPGSGKITLEASGFGWVSEVRTLAVSGQEGVVDFVLRPAVILKGRVIDAKGTGVADAEVRTFRGRQRPVRTNRDGYFRIGDFAAAHTQKGSVYLEATADGFAAKGEFVSLERARSEGVVMVLSVGWTLRGIVVDPDRRPVASASVIVRTRKSKAQHRAVARTDSEGQFVIVHLPAGRHQVVATHPLFALAIDRIEMGGENVDRDIELVLQQARVLRGTVRSAAGAPIADARVEARSQASPREAKGRERELGVRRVRTDQDGAFELAGLSLESVRVSARAPGFAPSAWVEVATNTTVQEIVLTPEAIVAGTVVDQRTGSPVPEFSVRIRVAGDQEKVWSGELLEFSDARGQWSSAGKRPLRPNDLVSVEIRAQGFAPLRIAGLRARADARPEDRVDALSAGVALRGVVVGEGGAALSNVTVRLAHGAGRGEQGAGKRAAGKAEESAGRETRADREGRFAFAGVPPGSVTVIVERGGADAFVHSARIPEGQSTWEVRVVVSLQGVIEAVVRDPGGAPSPDIEVRARALDVPGLGGRTWRGKTGAGGRFVFRDLPFGVYRVSRVENLVGKQLDTFARHVAVESSAPVEVELRGTGAGTIRGRLDLDFTPGTQSLVQLRRQYESRVPLAERVPPRFASIEAGQFVFSGIEPGSYAVEAWCQDAVTKQWHRGEAAVDVARRGDTRVDLRIRSQR